MKVSDKIIKLTFNIYFLKNNTPSVPIYLSCLTFCGQIDQTLTDNY